MWRLSSIPRLKFAKPQSPQRPQSQSSIADITFGKVYGLAILKSASNVTATANALFAAFVESDLPADEIAQQIRYTRQLNPPGQIFWGMKNLTTSQGGLAEKLARELYPTTALVPATPWLATTAAPARPALIAIPETNFVKVTWSKTDASEVRAWVLQRRVNGNWLTDILPPWRISCELATRPDVIAVTAIDRLSRAGAPAAVVLR